MSGTIIIIDVLGLIFSPLDSENDFSGRAFIAPKSNSFRYNSRMMTTPQTALYCLISNPHFNLPSTSLFHHPGKSSTTFFLLASSAAKTIA